MESDSYQISSTHLRWMVDLCRNKQVHLNKLTRGSSHSLDYVMEEGRSIPWEEYANIVSSLSKFFDEVDLRAAGRLSWQLAPLNTHANIGQILFNVRDQYLAIYGAAGYCSRNFPVESEIEQTRRHQLTIRMTMKAGAKTCYPFYTILAGQIEALTEAMGLRRALVTMKPVKGGAAYTVDYSNTGLFLFMARRALRWLKASRAVTREFALLRDAHERLLREHSEALTERHKAQMSVIEHQENFQLLGSNIQDVIWQMDARMNLSFVSPTALVALGYQESEFSVSSLFSESDLETFSRTCRQVLRAGHSRPVTLESQLMDKSGASIRYELKLLPHHRAGSLLCIARDISQARMNEIELANRISNYRIVTDSAMDGIITFDADNRITYANPAVTEIFGYAFSELVEMSVRELMPEALGDIRLRDFYRTSCGASFSGLELRGLRSDKSLVPLEVSFTSHDEEGTGLTTCILRDVSSRTQVERERQSLQTQLEAAQKMDSVGQLSGGITHDFNNLLVAILGYTDLAMQAETLESIDHYLEEIRKAGERGSDMTQKLLAFSRRQIIETRPVAAGDLIEGIQDMLSRLLPSNIEVLFRNEAHGVQLMADITQLEQVLINLAVNARDAMPRGGTLEISLSAGALESREGRQLIIRITDTGVGMDPEIQNRIFEPFYTTKPEGQGTGLGLAVVFSIVNQHRGFIKVDSNLGRGTTFTIYLPVANGQKETDGNTGDIEVMGGTETILIAEDNEQVRNLANLILTTAGYNIIEAVDGAEGVSLFRQLSPEIDLVIMDVVMPGMGGREAARLMKDHQPDARIVFTTGYAPDSVHTRFIDEETLPLISKPYGTRLLRQQVRMLLDGD